MGQGQTRISSLCSARTPGSASFRMHGNIFCDGTFGTVKCCPPFCQIVVLQAKVDEKRALPAAYALLTRKVRIFTYGTRLMVWIVIRVFR